MALFALVAVIGVSAQNALIITHVNGDVDAANIADVQEIIFSDDATTMTINGTVQVQTASVAQIAYGDLPKSLCVKYVGDGVVVTNPYFLTGVTVACKGANVTVTNTNVATEYTTELSGQTDNGSFTYVGDYKITIVLNGVSITNPSGGAIDVQCGKRIALELKKGTVSTLVDGVGGKQKAALYCKGHLEIDKAGTLNVTGNAKHAISAKEYIQLKKSDGVINILGAESDGIHCGQYFLANGYNVTIQNVKGDGVQAELSGATDYAEDYADGSLTIQGGKFDITLAGIAADALKSDTELTINDAKSTPELTINTTGDGCKAIKGGTSVSIAAGTINVTQSGMYVIESEPVDTTSVAAVRAKEMVSMTGGTLNVTSTAVCGKAISCDGDINLVGGAVTLAMSGDGAKGIKGDQNLYVGDQTTHLGPQLTISTKGSSYAWPDATLTAKGALMAPPGGGQRPPGGGGWGEEENDDSSAKAVKIMGTASVYGGQMHITTVSKGAEGFEAKKGVTIDGGAHYMKCYDDCINSNGPLTFSGGTTVCISTGNDAVDSNYGRTGAITISGGNVFAYTTAGGPEEGLDCDNNSWIVVKGGIAVSAGGSQGGGSSNSIGSSTQGYYLGSAPSSYRSANYYTLYSADNKPICTYRFDANLSNRLGLLTAPDLGKGTVTVKSGSQKPTQYQSSVNDVFFVYPTDVVTTSTVATVTAK